MLCVTLAASGVNAAVISWNVTDGQWSVAGNWSAGQVPTASDAAYVRNAGVVTIGNSTAAAANSLQFGDTSKSGGGVLMPDSSLTVATLQVGSGRDGYFTQEGGTISASSHFRINSTNNGHVAQYVLDDGLVTGAAANGIEIGRGGQFLQNGGSVSMTNAAGPVLSIGYTTGGVGTYTMLGGQVLGGASQVMYVGESTAGTFNQRGGLVDIGTVTISRKTGSGGVYNLSGGTLKAASIGTGSGYAPAFQFTGGALFAENVGFALTNSGGLLAPGYGGISDSATINGHLTLNAGTLQIELASLGFFDRLSVTGSATLGGALEVIPLNGFVPQDGDSWVILRAGGTVTGSFSSIPDRYRVGVVGRDVLLTYLPEPSSMVLLVTGSLALLTRRLLWSTDFAAPAGYGRKG
jgi:hypothetical protein